MSSSSAAAVETGMAGLINDPVSSIVYADNAPDPSVRTLRDFKVAAATRFNCFPENVLFTDLSSGHPLNSDADLDKTILELPSKIMVEITDAEGKDIRLYETTFVLSDAGMEQKKLEASSSSSSSSSAAGEEQTA